MPKGKKKGQDICYTLINTSSNWAKRKRKCCYRMEWQQKGIRYDPTKVDSWPSKNLRDHWHSHLVNRNYYDKKEECKRQEEKALLKWKYGQESSMEMSHHHYYL